MGFSKPQRDWLDQFIEWAMPRNDVRAAMVFGSQATRNNHQIDEWSDLDIAIFTSRPNLYTKDNSWMQNISSMWTGLIDTHEVWGGAVAASGFSVYEGGVIVDPIIIPTIRVRLVITCTQLFKLRPSMWQQMGNPVVNLCNEMLEFFRRGTIILFDKSNLIIKLENISKTLPQYPSSPPSAEKFQNSFDGFWVDPPRIVANLKRRQLVWAIRSFKPLMKQFFELAEWHACAKQGWHNETEYRTKLLEEWADPLIIEALPTIYPQYSIEETWNALLELIKLYRQLAEETTKMLGYNCDFTAADIVSAWVKECYQKDSI